DADGLPVTQAVTGQRFELVRRPVPEIEGARAPELEGIARGRNVRQVKLGAAPYELGDRGQLARRERRRLAPQPLKERAITNERHFDRFGHAGKQITLAEGLEKPRVVDDSARRRVCSDEVLLPDNIDTAL